MRGTKAKRLRKQDPSRPNPGRKHGGVDKDKVERRPLVVNYGKTWNREEDDG